MHFSMMRTALLLTVSRSVRSDGGGGGGSAQLPRMQISLHGCRPPSPWMQTPLPPDADPPVNRMTDRCKNITFAKFVCGR